MVAAEELALLMVKPDGVRQRLTPVIVGFLRARGYELLAIRRRTLDPDTRAQLYATTRSSGRLDWNLNGVLYTLGPVDALILRGTRRPGEYATASSHLSHELKGHFLPTKALPGTLRGDFNALNPIFNLVHASDSVDEFNREVGVLFGPDWIRLVESGSPDPLSGQSDEAPRLISHWSRVQSTLAHLLAPGSPESGYTMLDKAKFPGPDHDTVGLNGRRSAMEAAQRATVELRGMLSCRSADQGIFLFTNSENGFAPYSVFREEAAQRVPSISTWDLYLTYTTLRLLDLCLKDVS